MTEDAAKQELCGHCGHDRSDHTIDLTVENGFTIFCGWTCHCHEYVPDYKTFMADEEAQAALREVGLA